MQFAICNRFHLPSHRSRLAPTIFLLSLSLILLSLSEQLLDRVFPFPVAQLGAAPDSTRYLAADGRLLRVAPTTEGERLIRVSLDSVSPHVVQALVAGEDKRFFSHRGVDWLALVRACVTSARRGRVVSGASTVTMQVVRLIEPRPRTIPSKLIEIVRARQLERAATKDAILEAYLNRAPFGGTLRGIESAARYWFGKHAADLGPAEAATLVALLPAPSARAPHRRPARLTAMRNAVLARMHAAGYLDAAAHARAAARPLAAAAHPWPWLAPHQCDSIGNVRRGGEVRTGIDLDLQRRVEVVVRGHDDAGVDGVAVVVVERADGRVRALVGSRDYRRRPLDTTRCRRAAGSTLKPFLFALGLESGLIGPDSLLDDTRATFGDYAPLNFSRDFAGRIRASEALATSRNIPAVRLLAGVGVDRFRDLLRRAGLRARGRFGLDAALGTLAVSPLELARAYAALFRRENRLGLSDHTRTTLLQMLCERSPAPAWVAPSLLAWKTGTSSGRRDAWCVGVAADRVVAVWLGNLDGAGAPDLVGGRSAAGLLAAVAAVL